MEIHRRLANLWASFRSPAFECDRTVDRIHSGFGTIRKAMSSTSNESAGVPAAAGTRHSRSLSHSDRDRSRLGSGSPGFASAPGQSRTARARNAGGRSRTCCHSSPRTTNAGPPPWAKRNVLVNATPYGTKCPLAMSQLTPAAVDSVKQAAPRSLPYGIVARISPESTIFLRRCSASPLVPARPVK